MKCVFISLFDICENIAKKSLENEFWTKGNNSWKNMSTVKKVELNL